MKGFSLLELVIVLLIIGVLAAIAYPSMLDFVEEARAKEVLGILDNAIDAQSTYYVEKGYFANTWAALDVGSNESESHRFSSETLNNNQYALLRAAPKVPDVKGYLAGIETIKKHGSIGFESSICRAKKPGLKSFEKEAVEFKKRRVKCERSKKVG